MVKPQTAPRLIDVEYRLVFLGRFVGVAFLGFALLGCLLLLVLNHRLGFGYSANLTTLGGLQDRLPVILLIVGSIQMAVVGTVTFLLSLFWSHAVSGPLVRVHRCLQLMAGSQTIEDMRFRKTDQLHGLADAFQHFTVARQRRRETFEVCLAQADDLLRECERLAAQQPGAPPALREQRTALKRVYEQMRELLMSGQPR